MNASHWRCMRCIHDHSGRVCVDLYFLYLCAPTEVLIISVLFFCIWFLVFEQQKHAKLKWIFFKLIIKRTIVRLCSYFFFFALLLRRGLIDCSNHFWHSIPFIKKYDSNMIVLVNCFSYHLPAHREGKHAQCQNNVSKNNSKFSVTTWMNAVEIIISVAN